MILDKKVEIKSYWTYNRNVDTLRDKSSEILGLTTLMSCHVETSEIIFSCFLRNIGVVPQLREDIQF